MLSLRPGGLRKQLAFVARRLRIMLILGGIYVLASTVVKLFAPEGPVAEYAPPILAVGVLIGFLFVARDPAPGGARSQASTAGRNRESGP